VFTIYKSNNTILFIDNESLQNKNPSSYKHRLVDNNVTELSLVKDALSNLLGPKRRQVLPANNTSFMPSLQHAVAKDE